MTASRESRTAATIEAERRASRPRAATGITSIARMAQPIAVTTAGFQALNASTDSPRTLRLLTIGWLPTCRAAKPATATDTISSGIASVVARPKSYNAAKAVKTSVVKTRTRSRPGTENSEMASTKMTSAADTTLGGDERPGDPPQDPAWRGDEDGRLFQSRLDVTNGDFGCEHRQRIAARW